MTQTTISRDRAIVLNRIMICAAVSLAFASYLWQPLRWVEYIIDIVLRAYLHFIAGSLAHEAVHGHLGNSRSSNAWWGRVALLPTISPFVTFRKAHMHHHSATNIPGKDPDEFLNTPRKWEIPFRALLLPSYWLIWLWKNGRLTGRDRMEYALTCAAQVLVFNLVAQFAGTERVLWGLIPSGILHAVVLWYCFAVKTHEGYSTGAPESRSHDYYGRPLYWLTFGLSMHRLHHMQPRLAWLQMANHVVSGTPRQRLRFERSIERA
jgi:fatty acid desaturase